MSATIGWLPELIVPNSGEEWRDYENRLYDVYDKGFLFSQPFLFKKRVRAKSGVIGEKNSGFWHLISSGEMPDMPEIERDCDLDRCYRIGWPRAIIEAAEDKSRTICWENVRQTKHGNERRTLIALVDFSYKVVIANREDNYTLWTAYLNRPHQAERDKKECLAYRQANNV